MLNGIDREDVLARAYPGGVPAAERAHVDALPSDQAAVVLRRLDAILRTGSGELTPGEGAVAAGLGRTAFHAARRTWSAHTSLFELTPYAMVERREAINLGGSVDAVPVAKAVVAQTPSYVSAHHMAIETVRRSKNAVSYNTALRLVRAARRGSVTDPEYLLEHYGTGIVIDLCAIDLPLTIYDGDELAVAALVIEKSAGLLLGVAAGPKMAERELQWEAVRRARDMLRVERIDTAADAQTVQVAWVKGNISAPVVPDPGSARWEVVSSGSRRFGTRAVSALGKRLGRISLMPRATSWQEPVPWRVMASRSPVNPEDADSLLLYEAANHNGPILEALRKAERRGLQLNEEGSIGTVLGQLAEHI
ncbi:hypothetical protein [uncultured Sphingomonas sp.]|uniref:hypothetical protein n=1 Tax=uncultured Sphingomonas sp. TaxID=158754 RepID=UPI001576E2AA